MTAATNELSEACKTLAAKRRLLEKDAAKATNKQ
jgi:hypothetical protein